MVQVWLGPDAVKNTDELRKDLVRRVVQAHATRAGTSLAESAVAHIASWDLEAIPEKVLSQDLTALSQKGAALIEEHARNMLADAGAVLSEQTIVSTRAKTPKQELSQRALARITSFGITRAKQPQEV